jgi:hypothetical protein
LEDRPEAGVGGEVGARGEAGVRRTGREQALPYGGQLVSDVLDRTETAMPQAHCFLATELALRAQKAAQRVSLG